MGDCVSYFKDLIFAKIRDSNKAKSSLANPQLKTCVTHPVHEEVFKRGFLTNGLVERW